MRGGKEAVSSRGMRVKADALVRRILMADLTAKTRVAHQDMRDVWEFRLCLLDGVGARAGGATRAFDVSEDAVDDCGVGDVGDDPEGASAQRTARDVDVESAF